ILLYHGGGFATRYAHLSSIRCAAGQFVARGQVIGLVGSTGWSTGPHLHFEVRINGAAQNPLQYLE
ncbi:MAG: M23 family metallopeptidase, partial [Actinomycetia bacterium]|nr:M23 family metallopeptidase [Actinomycetes bacterium]